MLKKLPVLFIYILMYIAIHTLFQLYLIMKDLVKHLYVSVNPDRQSHPRIQVKETNQIVVDTQRPQKLLLMPLPLFLLQFLCRTVQKKALIEQFTVLLQ